MQKATDGRTQACRCRHQCREHVLHLSNRLEAPKTAGTDTLKRTCRKRFAVELLMIIDTAAHVEPSAEENQTCESKMLPQNDACLLKGRLMQVNRIKHGHLVFCCSEHVSPKKTSRKYQAKLIQKGQLNKKPSTFVQPGILSTQKWLFRICRKCKRQHI